MHLKIFISWDKYVVFIAEASVEQNEHQEDKYFQKIYEQWKGAKATDKDITYKVIPKFYFKVIYTNTFSKDYLELVLF